jgi:CheY-like chemotaxis protein
MRGSETMLIADDYESIREMARQTLAGLGYRVLCAADGEEGLWLCEQNTPQIAVLAVVMPKLGGERPRPINCSSDLPDCA